jgi:alpha-1,3-mannosyltransferase
MLSTATETLVLGIAVTGVKADQGVALLDRKIDSGQRVCLGFLNAHAAVLAATNAAFRDALQKFIMFNDGVGLDLARWMKYGAAFTENLNGTDFTPYYLANTRHTFRIFLLGAKPHVVEQAAKTFAERFPRHAITGFHDGYSPQGDALVETIRAQKADLILVGMGNPLQELWIAENLEKTGAMMALAVGALFDFEAGHVARAPHLVRRVRAEWLFRWLWEPRRLWKRYTLESALFLGYALRDAMAYRLRRRSYFPISR